MKKILSILIALMSFIAISCDKSDDDNIVLAESMQLNVEELVIEEGQVRILHATVFPTDALNKDVIWASSDNNIATVEKGVVKAIKRNGNISITATIKDTDISKICKVTTIEPFVFAESVILDTNELSLNINEEKTLNATVTPSNATVKDIQWSVKDIDIATVDNEGKVKALKEGVTEIYATAKGTDIKDVCKLTVIDNTKVKVERIEISRENVEINGLPVIKLTAKVYPENATNKKVYWDPRGMFFYSSKGENNEICLIQDMGPGSYGGDMACYSDEDNKIEAVYSFGW